MLELSRALSRGLDFVRVDMYNFDGRIYVGELTSYPMSGVFPFVPYSLDELLGSYWKLSSMTYLPFRPRRRPAESGRARQAPSAGQAAPATEVVAAPVNEAT